MQTLPRRGLFLLGGAAALVLTGCGTGNAGAPGGETAKTTTITHARGEIEIPWDAQRVVVFDTVTLDTLSALGVKPAGCPAGVAFPQRLTDFLTGVAGVGSLSEPDLEAVNSLNPDLIIVGGRSAKAYEALAKIATTIDLTLPEGDPIEGLKERAATVGTIFGKSGEVGTQLAEVETIVTDLKGLSANAGKGLIVMVSGGKLTAFGPGSRFGVIHDTLGLAPAAPKIEVEGHGQQISFEFIAQTNPDVLYVIDRDAAIGEEGAKAAMQVLDTPLVKDTKAGKNGKIVELNGSKWYIVGNGLANLPEMLAEVRPGFAAS